MKDVLYTINDTISERRHAFPISTVVRVETKEGHNQLVVFFTNETHIVACVSDQIALDQLYVDICEKMEICLLSKRYVV